MSGSRMPGNWVGGGAVDKKNFKCPDEIILPAR